MAEVLLTHSYHLPYDPKQMRKMQPYPPLGTLYAASALRSAGISVAVFDSMLREPATEFADALAFHWPKIVAIYEDDFNFLSKMCLTRMREVAWEIARASHEAGAVVVVHGSDSTDNAALFLENGCDYVLCGEAELSLTHLCSAVLHGHEIDEIEGVARFDRDRRVIRNQAKLAKNPSWAELPPPARDLVDLEPYRAAWMDAHGYFSTNMVASRGCPYRCNWCAKPISGNKFHLRNAAEVAEEMSRLKRTVGLQHIWFGDDVFALDKKWVLQFAAEVAKRDAALPFKIQSRADLMNDETVRALEHAGCSEVWMGVESGCQAVLDAMDKGLDLRVVVSARNRLREAEIRACYFLQFGYPGEGWAELQQTVQFVRETRPDDIGISFSYPLPGTIFHERVQAQLGPKTNWTDSDDLCIMFQASHTTAFYRAVRDALHAEVNSWREPKTLALGNNSTEELWAEVDRLEPVSRNANAHAFADRGKRVFVPNNIVPLHRVGSEV